MATCIECGTSKARAKGLCGACYQRARHNPTPQVVPCVKCGTLFDREMTRRKYCSDDCRLDRGRFERTTERACVIEGCDRYPNGARGLCRRHYSEASRRGDFGGEQCSVDGCERLAGWGTARNPNGHVLCQLCYKRLKRTGLLPTRPCSVVGCDGFAEKLDLCARHYWRLTTKGDVGSPGRLRREDGLGYVDPNGYVNVQVDNRKMLQHRRVMEQILGRPLLRTESVHHINGQRDDNRPENLELWSRSQPAGQRVADKVAWGIELLALYEPDVLA